MKILGLETSSKMGSVALNSRSTYWEREKSHSEFVTFQVEKILTASNLTAAELDLLAVGIGPGSFTGIRVGLNIARAFSFVHKQPIFTCNSLLLIAWPVIANAEEPVAVMVNAFRNMVYFARYQMQNETLVELTAPCAVPAQNLNSYISESHIVLGDGFDAYQTQIDANLLPLLQRNSIYADYPHAKSLVELSQRPELKQQFFAWDQVVPLYIRASEAEEKLSQKLFK